MTERDTHFAGFARLLIEEVYANGPQTIDVFERIIAQRAYDLVRHALEQASHGEHAFDAEIVFHRQVTDLAQWPEPPTTAE